MSVAAMRRTKRPFGLGFNGHARICDCTNCARQRANRTAELWQANGSYAVWDPKKTIFVRSHFRSGKRKPNTAAAIRRLARGYRR